MAERYPDDATLLALVEDDATGVTYIETGKTPYHLEFRRMLQRLLLAGSRANDLRVYQDGDLTIGVRGGRCYINGTAVLFEGVVGVSIAPGTTSYVWIDDAGMIAAGSVWPADRTLFIPLAEVVADSAMITSLTDRRGEAFLYSPSLGSLGLAATGLEIDRALAGAGVTVTAGALDRLTGGASSNADVDHRHLQSAQDVAGDAFFSLVNISADVSAGMMLAWSMPNRLVDATTLGPNVSTGFLEQSFDGETFTLVGAVHVQYVHEGVLGASVSGKLVGMTPVAGRVVDVVLSVGSNIVSSNGADGISATVKKHGVAVTTSSPDVTAGDGGGFRSTDQGDGSAAAMKSDGSELTQRGDVLTVDLTRTAAGTVSNEAMDVVVLVVIRADRPE